MVSWRRLPRLLLVGPVKVLDLLWPPSRRFLPPAGPDVIPVVEVLSEPQGGSRATETALGTESPIEGPSPTPPEGGGEDEALDLDEALDRARAHLTEGAELVAGILDLWEDLGDEEKRVLEELLRYFAEAYRFVESIRD